MTVGTVVKLKRECLGNPVGTFGVCFYDYGNGCQFIFENGNYDGFGGLPIEFGEGVDNEDAESEQDMFLEEIGVAVWMQGYQFRNVIQVSNDYSKGFFDRVLKDGKEAFK